MRHPVLAALLAASPYVFAQADPSTPSPAPIQVRPATSEAATTSDESRSETERVGLQEIVVTAQKREQDINDVSIAISAFTGDTLEALGITDTRQLSGLVPGFTYADSGFNTPVYTLRGVGFNEASQTASSTVGVYVDEFNLPFPVMSKGANLDLQRVEVLKGPQGTLYGRNTTGGAINYVANKPTEDLETGLSATYGSYETADVEGFISGALTHTILARLAIRGVHSDQGWQDSLTRSADHFGRVDRQAGRLSLDWEATPSLRVRAGAEGWYDRSEPQVPQAVALRSQNPILGNAALSPETRNHPLVPFDTDDATLADWPDHPPAGKKQRLHDGFAMGTMRADWAVTEEVSLAVLGAISRFESDGSSIPQSGLSVEYVTDRIIDVDTKARSLEMRLSGSNGPLTWLTGAFMSTDNVSEVQDYFAGKVSAVFPLPVESNAALEEINMLLGAAGLPQLGATIADRLVLLGTQKAETRAIFGNTEWRLADPLKLTVGARYTDEKRTFSGCSADSPDRTQGVGFGAVFSVLSLAQGGTGTADPAHPLCFTIDQQTHDKGLSRPDPLHEDNVSGRLALDWTPGEEVLLYVSFSRGYKSGSFPVLSSSRSDQYEPVTQERLNAWEVGIKNQFLDGALQVDAAIFHYAYKDKQLLSHLNDPVFGPLPVLANAPKSRVVGAEAQAQWSPVRGSYLSAALSYLDTEIRKFTGIDNDGNPADYAGEPFNFAPTWSGTLIGSVTLPTGNRWETTLGVDTSFTDSTNSQLGRDPRFAHEDYALVNARISSAPIDSRWRVTLWGRNLTNEYYTLGVFNPGDTIGRYVGMPRTVGVTVGWNADS